MPIAALSIGFLRVERDPLATVPTTTSSTTRRQNACNRRTCGFDARSDRSSLLV
jgi:hypothetical protein